MSRPSFQTAARAFVRAAGQTDQGREREDEQEGFHWCVAIQSILPVAEVILKTQFVVVLADT